MFLIVFDQRPTTHPLSFPLGSAALGTLGLGPFGALPKKPARPAERWERSEPWSCVGSVAPHFSVAHSCPYPLVI